MSVDSFMRGGNGELLLTVPTAEPYGPIEVYEIGDVNFVGVLYTDYKGDRQAQPRVWWYDRLHKAGVQQLIPPPAARPKLMVRRPL